MIIRRAARTPLLALLLTAAALPLRAQERPAAYGIARAAAEVATEPGAAVRRVLEVEAPAAGGIVPARIPLAGREPVRWAIRPEPGVRVLGPAEGLHAADAVGEGLLVTFGLPRSQAAGRALVGTVHLRSGAAEEVVEVVTRLAPIRALDVELTMPDSVQPGELVSGRFRVRNRGTAEDTVVLRLDVDAGWQIAGAPGLVTVARGEIREGVFRMRIPAEAELWSTSSVRLSARGLGASALASQQVLVIAGRGEAARRARIPVQLTTGAAAADAGAPGARRLSFGLESQGEIAPGLRLEILAQDHEVGQAIPAYPGARSTSLLRARLHAETWAFGIGDASTRAGLLPRFHAAGRGLDGAWRSGGFDARAAVFYPRVGWGIDPAGQVLSAGAGMRTPAGRLGIALLHADRTSTVGGTPGTGRSVALQYGIHRGSHRLDLEGGWLASETPSAGDLGGAAFDAAYLYSGRGASMSASLRRAPETALLGGGIRSESSLSGAYAFGRHWSGHASVFAYQANSGEFAFFNDLGERRLRVEPSAAGGSSGVRWSSGRHSAGFSGQVLRRETLGHGELRRTMTAEAGRAIGAFRLQGSAELGDRTLEGGERRDVQRYRGTFSWSGTQGSVWATTERANEGPPFSVALNAALRLRRMELETTLNTFRDSLALPTTTLSTSLSVPVARATTLRLGAEYRPWALGQVSPWAVAIGFRRTVGVPLPERSRPGLRGILFQDVNGNGAHDEGEPGFAGVVVSSDGASTRTGTDGRFWFPSAPRGEVQVAQRMLPYGALVVPGATRRQGSILEIPVVSTADLRVRAVLQDTTGEEVTGTGLRVLLRDARGHERETMTDSAGVAEFHALIPGEVTLTIDSPAPDRAQRRVPAVARRLAMAPGEAMDIRIEVPFTPREVRFSTVSGNRE